MTRAPGPANPAACEPGLASNGCAPQGLASKAAAGSSNGCAALGLAAAQDPLVASLLTGLDEADPFELDARLRRALAAELRLEATMGPWLLAVARGRLYRAHGCSCLGDFARERLGMSPSKAEALVRLERACEASPPLREAYRAGRLSWAQAQLLTPIVKYPGSAPWQAAWVELAGRITVRRLDDEVARALSLGRLAPPALDPPAGSWDDGRAEGRPDPRASNALADTDPDPTDATGLADAADRLEAVHGARRTQRPGPPPREPQTGAHRTLFPKSMAFFFTAPRDVARLFRGALATVQRRIEQRNGRTASESEALDAVLEHAFLTWGLANAALQREHRVFERDGWRCTFPGCTSYGNLQDHHIEYRSHGGSNALSNRTTLCVWHHQRGEHAKILRCRGKAPARLRFELGLRRGRSPLARYRSGDVRS